MAAAERHRNIFQTSSRLPSRAMRLLRDLASLTTKKMSMIPSPVTTEMPTIAYSISRSLANRGFEISTWTDLGLTENPRNEKLLDARVSFAVLSAASDWVLLWRSNTMRAELMLTCLVAKYSALAVEVRQLGRRLVKPARAACGT